MGLWEPGHERENEEKWMNLGATKTSKSTVFGDGEGVGSKEGVT